MSVLVHADTKVLVQGIVTWHVPQQNSLAYKTRVVAGVTPGRA
jgi:succinyl-CoA synthetase alpha subunit